VFKVRIGGIEPAVVCAEFRLLAVPSRHVCVWSICGYGWSGRYHSSVQQGTHVSSCPCVHASKQGWPPFDLYSWQSRCKTKPKVPMGTGKAVGQKPTPQSPTNKTGDARLMDIIRAKLFEGRGVVVSTPVCVCRRNRVLCYSSAESDAGKDGHHSLEFEGGVIEGMVELRHHEAVRWLEQSLESRWVPVDGFDPRTRSPSPVQDTTRLASVFSNDCRTDETNNWKSTTGYRSKSYHRKRSSA
jgi:hypothetical protein